MVIGNLMNATVPAKCKQRRHRVPVGRRPGTGVFKEQGTFGIPLFNGLISHRRLCGLGEKLS
jgi:hypothetical protein